LGSPERQLWDDYLAYFAPLALHHAVPAEDRAFWTRLTDQAARERLLDDPDFACCEGISWRWGGREKMRALAGERGAQLAMDERVGASYAARNGNTEWFLYGFSVLHCLLVGLTEQPSAGTGTVMRPDTFRRYALEAGLRDVEILPIDNFFYTCYRPIG
jgi:hypothetical protein